MNDQDFILLMEKYFDGTITPEDRTALKNELLASPARRSLFETQSRQNIRLHAQTSPIDFTESQRIAIAVMDTVEQFHHPATFADIMKEQTFGERLAALREGLRAPRYSGKNRYARFVLMRLITPPSIAIVLSVIIILSLISVVPKMFPVAEPDDDTDKPVITLLHPPLRQAPAPVRPAPISTPDQTTPIPPVNSPRATTNQPAPDPSRTPKPHPSPLTPPDSHNHIK